MGEHVSGGCDHSHELAVGRLVERREIVMVEAIVGGFARVGLAVLAATAGIAVTLWSATRFLEHIAASLGAR